MWPTGPPDQIWRAMAYTSHIPQSNPINTVVASGIIYINGSKQQMFLASQSRRKSKMPELARLGWILELPRKPRLTGRSERDFAHRVRRVYAMKSDCNLWSLELCNLSLGLQVRYPFFSGRAVNPKLIKHRQLAGNCLRKQKNLLFDGFDLPRHKFWGE